MTDTEIKALIERLRDYGPHNEGSAFRICDEAADALEAIRNAALEEAARVAEKPINRQLYANDIGPFIATAIRALKEGA